mmetsp:Transcript_18335/g.55332  ORF Transcript_18335/g.55332 Transcript_18335/m.55332 type:complete len:353 (-) Transcript_18335:827-1885(-)
MPVLLSTSLSLQMAGPPSLHMVCMMVNCRRGRSEKTSRCAGPVQVVDFWRSGLSTSRPAHGNCCVRSVCLLVVLSRVHLVVWHSPAQRMDPFRCGICAKQVRGMSRSWWGASVWLFDLPHSVRMADRFPTAMRLQLLHSKSPSRSPGLRLPIWCSPQWMHQASSSFGSSSRATSRCCHLKTAKLQLTVSPTARLSGASFVWYKPPSFKRAFHPEASNKSEAELHWMTCYWHVPSALRRCHRTRPNFLWEWTMDSYGRCLGTPMVRLSLPSSRHLVQARVRLSPVSHFRRRSMTSSLQAGRMHRSRSMTSPSHALYLSLNRRHLPLRLSSLGLPHAHVFSSFLTVTQPSTCLT